MDETDATIPEFDVLMSKLSGLIDLEATARSCGALLRRRQISDAGTLLRLALAYGPGGKSLRSAAAWAGGLGIAQLSNVALLKRLRGCADWLGEIAGALVRHAAQAGEALDAGAEPGRARAEFGRRLRMTDGSSISGPGSTGTDFRLHATYEPALGRFTHLELSDVHGGEAFSRTPLQPGDVLVGDRGYARAVELAQVVGCGGDFIVRTGWRSLRLLTADGDLLDWAGIFAPLPPGGVCGAQVQVDYSPTGTGRRRARLPVRLVVCRLDQQAAEAAVTSVRRNHQRRRNKQKLQPLTLRSAEFIMLLTSVPAHEMSDAEVLAAYRLRWQVEIAFKRLKSGLGIDKLPAKDPGLAQSWLMAHLILALFIEEAASDLLDSPPCADRISADRNLVLSQAVQPPA